MLYILVIKAELVRVVLIVGGLIVYKVLSVMEDLYMSLFTCSLAFVGFI